MKGYKDKGSFVLTPNYMASSSEQMFNLIGVSESCQQYIQYDCYKSKLYKGTDFDDAEVSSIEIFTNLCIIIIIHINCRSELCYSFIW